MRANEWVYSTIYIYTLGSLIFISSNPWMDVGDVILSQQNVHGYSHEIIRYITIYQDQDHPGESFPDEHRDRALFVRALP